MAKKTALLFELMKEEPQPQAQKGFWGQLFRKKGPTPPESAPEPTREEFSPPAEGSAPVQTLPTAPFSSAEARPEPYDQTDEMQLYLRVNAFSKVLGITVVLVIFFCGYILGNHFGWRAGLEKRSDQQLSQIAAQEPDSEVLKVGPEDRSTKKNTLPAETSSPSTAGPAEDIFKNEGKITRKDGLNYLIIHVSWDLPEVERARQFLATKGIETSVERVKSSVRKSTLYVLVGAAGFNLKEPQEKQQSQAFIEMIKAKGQQYRQVKGSNGLDFKSCYYQRWPISK